MKKLILESFTHRFGNVLAIANLSLIAINRSGLTWELGSAALIRYSFLVNLPARIASIIILGDPYSTGAPWYIDLSHYTFGALVFVYLQWLFIGWFATQFANAIQPKQG